ncbi:MAG: GTP-binding protein [Lachnospiraceae bacterium]
MEEKSFASFEREEVKEPIEFHVEKGWEKHMTEYKEGYQHLLLHLKQCKYVKILFDSENEPQILCSDNMDIIMLNNFREKTWNWQEFIYKFENTKYLNIRNCEELPDSIFEMKQLIYLVLNHCKLDKFNFDNITKLTKLTTLSLMESEINVLPEILYEMKALNVLSIMHTNIKELSNSLGKLKQLRYLGLNDTKLNNVPVIIGELENLSKLFLGGTNIRMLPVELKALTKLEDLVLWGTQIESLPDWICTYASLKGLYLGNTKKLQKLPEDIGNLSNLEKLYLDRSGLTELPASFGKLANLKELLLSGTNIRKFPELVPMNHLYRCDLRDMVLERIPKELFGAELEIGSFRFDMGLILSNTQLLCQPISLFSHEREFIDAYYEEEKIHLNEAKVVFLGDGEAGKSHIIKRIMTDNQVLKQFKEDSTPGIAISQKVCNIDREAVRLQIWDFGGQEIMHSMHRFFLTERTLYVIVINARDNTQDERAEYWLNNVKNFANGCPVIMVLNKIDQNPTASINERMLRTDYPQIKQILKMSALKDIENDFGKLMESIISAVKMFDSYAMDFPVSWNRIKTQLEEMDNNYIVDSEYRKICIDNSVVDEQIQNWLLDWFHDLGISFNYHRKDQLLSGYMVLKPTWITNAIYIILFNGSEYARNGLIRIKDIIALLKNPPKSVEKIHYNIIEVPYILGVMRRFEISYSVDKDNEFVPMMCDKNQHEEAERFTNADCMQYYMKYAYLPNNVLHKLMIKMQADLDKDKIWLTGMILHSRENNIAALVRMHDRCIEIFIKSSNNNVYNPKEYLSEIRENLININKELNLVAEDTIVYKENNKSEEISYDTLLIHLSSEQIEYFSPIFRKKISIRKILGMVENEVDTNFIVQYCKENKDVTYPSLYHTLIDERNKTIYNELEDDILECGLKIQGDSLLILAGKENDRNTYFRNMLSVNKKYVICDQTLNGVSANRKAAGELDLLIKNREQMPIAIIEALTLSSVNKKYISGHIDKLFSYDTWGLPNNYILAYIEKCNFETFKKRYKKFIQEYAYPVKCVDVGEKSKYAEMAVFDVNILRNGKKGRITHILINLQEGKK